MRVILLNPAFSDIYGPYRFAAKVGARPQIPLGLCYLGGALQKEGHEVRIIDCEVEPHKGGASLIQETLKFSPDVLGVTATTPLIHKANELIKTIKDSSPNILTVLGGVHVSSVLEGIYQDLHSTTADVCVYGEGERTLLEILRAHKAGEPFDSIPGVLFKSNGKIRRTAPPVPLPIDSIPNPARDLLEKDHYQWSVRGKGIQSVTSLITLRGCPYGCKFCSVKRIFPAKVRFRNTDRVIDEIGHITQDLRIHHIMVQDDTLTLDQDRTAELCKKIIQNGLKFTFEGYTRADLISESLLRLMKQAGLVRLSFGVESGNDEILKAIGKNITREAIRKGYEICSKIGIETRCSYMIGHPFETKDTAEETVRFVNSLDVYQAYINISTPYPGSELYGMARKGIGGLSLLTNDWKEYQRYGNPVIRVNDLTPDDLKKLQRKAYQRFYLRPKIIWYNLKRAGVGAAVVNSLAFVKSITSALAGSRKHSAEQRPSIKDKVDS